MSNYPFANKHRKQQSYYSVEHTYRGQNVCLRILLIFHLVYRKLVYLEIDFHVKAYSQTEHGLVHHVEYFHEHKNPKHREA